MIVFITIRVGDAICPRASHFSPSEGTHENPALATCVGGTSWVTLGEQTRVICRECRSGGLARGLSPRGFRFFGPDKTHPFPNLACGSFSSRYCLLSAQRDDF